MLLIDLRAICPMNSLGHIISIVASIALNLIYNITCQDIFMGFNIEQIGSMLAQLNIVVLIRNLDHHRFRSATLSSIN